MSEEEKKAIETLKGLTVYYDDYSLLDEEEIEENDNVNKSIQLMIDLIERLEKELNNLKEIEQQHKTDNGLLRQELDMQIEHNKELEATLKQTQDSWFEDTQKLGKEKERNNELEIELSIRDNINVDKLVEKYRYYRRLAASYQANCISKEKIRAKIEELEKEQKEYKKSQEWEIQDDTVAQISILEELLEEK